MVRDLFNLKSRGSIGRTQAVSIPSALRCSQSPGDQKAESFVRTVHKADGLDIPTLNPLGSADDIYHQNPIELGNPE